MWVLRVLAVVVVAAIGAGIVGYLVTRDRRYLSLAWLIGKYALIFALAVLSLLFLERVAGMA